MKQNGVQKATGMNIYTIVVCAVLVALMAAAYVYLLTTEDFVAPTDSANTAEEETSATDSGEKRSAVWDATMEDLIAYMDELGFIDADDGIEMSPVGTVNYIFNGIDFIWWDVDNLEEGTFQYEYWQQMNENGYILLYGQYIYLVQQNGPFAICATSNYPGDDVDALYEAFAKFPGGEE